MSAHQEDENKSIDDQGRETPEESERATPPARGNSDEIVADQTQDVTPDPSKPE